MAFSVDPLTFIISIPQADLTLVSGTIYELDTDQFRKDLKAWEASVEGIAFLKTHNHFTTYTIAGTVYARAIGIIAPYSIEFEDGQYSVILVGSNNNIFDVAGAILEQNQVQVIPTNSAGLIEVATGSGVTEQDKLDIADRVWDEILSGASHNIPNSSGRRLRELGDAVSASVSDASPSLTAFTTNLTESRDDFYNDQLVRFTSGNLEGLVRIIRDYNGTTKQITVSEELVELPDNGMDFVVVPIHVHPIEQIVDSILDEPMANHNILNTFGAWIRKILYGSR